MTTPAEPQSPDRPAIARQSVITEARRHQRRRRQVLVAALVAPLAIGGLFVGLRVSDTGRQVAVVATPPVRPSSKWHMPQPNRGALPMVPSPSNVVVLNPATGDVVEAQKSAAEAAALKAAQSAVAAQFANTAQAQEKAASAHAEAQTAAAAAAAQAR